MFTYLLIHYIDYNILTLHMKGFSLEKNIFFPECVYRFHEKCLRYDRSGVYVGIRFDEKLCNTHALYLVI